MKTGRERLRDWIKRSQVSQTQAAKILSVHPVMISEWLGGTRRPGLENAVKIEQITGISVESWLLTEVSPTVAEDAIETSEA